MWVYIHWLSSRALSTLFLGKTSSPGEVDAGEGSNDWRASQRCSIVVVTIATASHARDLWPSRTRHGTWR